MENTNITFIGAGNIGRALMVGLISTGTSAEKITVSNPSTEKLQWLQEHLNVQTTQDNIDAVKNADIVVLAVKPSVMPVVCKELKAVITERSPLIISVASGITTQMIEAWFGANPAIVRAMPNTPAAVSAGATGLYANDFATEEQKELAESLFRAVGISVWLDKEALIDSVIAVSGSGPAYCFLFMEAMQQAAQSMGLDENVARLLTSQTVLGAARMAMETEQNVMQLRESVTSPNGTTEAAINVFEAGNIRQLIVDAMQAARNRSEEMAAENSEDAQ